MDQWKRFRSKDELIAALDKELAKIPGVAYQFTQPMAMRIDETISGVKADLAIKVFGDDFRTLDTLGQQVLRFGWVGPHRLIMNRRSGLRDALSKVNRSAASGPQPNS